MHRFLLSAVFTVASLISSLSYSAPVLQIDGSGQLTGATGVEVDGLFYDVSFVDDSCINAYTGCDSRFDDFVFPIRANALLASQALLDQVFVDGAQGNFDSDSELTFGCTSDSFCNVFTPWDIDGLGGVALVYARNWQPPNNDFTGHLGSSLIPIEQSWETSGNNVYAVWTASSVSSVPVPAGAWLFLSALGGLAGIRYKKKR